MKRVSLLLIAVLMLGAGVVSARQLAVAPGNEHFQRTWERTDKPVLDGLVSRTWMWSPEAFTNVIEEPYAESPGGTRQVQYFDKARMEITQAEAGDPTSIWYVTNGLLVVEMMTEMMQVGVTTHVEREPAWVPVAGDTQLSIPRTSRLSYRFMSVLRDQEALDVGETITWILTPGAATNYYLWDESLAGYGVTAAFHVPETGHAVASPFWEFMNSSGVVMQGEEPALDLLFPNPFYATGLPVTDAYWAIVPVAGIMRTVLVQCFERRCLTYTPDNPDGWKVEAGNVGQHYYDWRYNDADNTPPIGMPTATATSFPLDMTATTVRPTATATSTETASATPTNEPTPTPTPTIGLVAPEAPSGLVGFGFATVTPYCSELQISYLVTLSFIDNADDEDGFVLTSGIGSYQLLPASSGTGEIVGALDTVHTSGSNVPYTVHAFNEAGESEPAHGIAFLTPPQYCISQGSDGPVRFW